MGNRKVFLFLVPCVVQFYKDVLAEPLSVIFQQSFARGILPPDWKTTNIVPIYKNGSRSDKENYRPVSLTSVLCKFWKILQYLLKYLNVNKTPCKEQPGFANGRSCLTNLLETFEN